MVTIDIDTTRACRRFWLLVAAKLLHACCARKELRPQGGNGNTHP